MAVQFNDQTFNLKYLFKVEMKDGEIYEQNKDDVSKRDKTKSAFYDIKDRPIKKFKLERWGEKHEVNLETGEFIINGIHLALHDEDIRDFRLIYYRRHKHNFQQGKQTSHDVEYHFGWQANLKGHSIKRIIMLK
jgi:hypothetical protein